MTHSALIARLEAAEVGNPELTALMALLIDGVFHPGEERWLREGFVSKSAHPHPATNPNQLFWPEPYTTSLDAITALVERKLPGSWIALNTLIPSALLHSPLSSGGGPRWRGEAKTAPLALCIALLKAFDDGVLTSTHEGGDR